MEPIGDHIRAYNFQIEISGAAVGVAKQVLGLDGVSNSGLGAGGILAARSPVEVAGAGARFGGQYYVNPVTHTIGGNSSAAPGATVVPLQLKVIVLAMRPTDHRGANELSVWWGQKTSPQLGRRSVAIVQRDATGRELRRYSMDGWLVTWQGPPILPGRPDPPPEVARVEIAAANLRLGR
ncbi:MAG: hypothetical protein WD733_11770 [Bryobacterales bacterium]